LDRPLVILSLWPLPLTTTSRFVPLSLSECRGMLFLFLSEPSKDRVVSLFNLTDVYPQRQVVCPFPSSFIRYVPGPAPGPFALISSTSILHLWRPLSQDRPLFVLQNFRITNLFLFPSPFVFFLLIFRDRGGRKTLSLFDSVSLFKFSLFLDELTLVGWGGSCLGGGFFSSPVFRNVLCFRPSLVTPQVFFLIVSDLSLFSPSTSSRGPVPVSLLRNHVRERSPL